MGHMTDAVSNMSARPARQSTDGARQLNRHADAIRTLGKRIKEDVQEIGRRLTICKKILGHGNFGPWLDREFGWSTKTAQNFMRVYDLSASKNVNFTNFNVPVTGLYRLAAQGTPEEAVTEIIERAKTGENLSLKHVGAAITRANGKTDAQSGVGTARQKTLDASTPLTRAATHTDILEVWLRASSEARQHAVDSIGLEAWFAAVPPTWLLQLKILIAERQPSAPPARPQATPITDRGIPEFLKREPCASVKAVGRDDSADGDDNDDNDGEIEPAPKPKRKVKLIEYETTVAAAIGDAFEAVSDLANECRDIVDNASASEGLQQTQRIQTFEMAADQLEELEPPDVPAMLGEMMVKYSIPKRRYLSRQSRASDAMTLLEACAEALDQIAEDNENHIAAEELSSELKNAIGAIESCEFPGMYG
jgi:hypothetical protein